MIFVVYFKLSQSILKKLSLFRCIYCKQLSSFSSLFYYSFFIFHFSPSFSLYLYFFLFLPVSLSPYLCLHLSYSSALHSSYLLNYQSLSLSLSLSLSPLSPSLSFFFFLSVSLACYLSVVPLSISSAPPSIYLPLRFLFSLSVCFLCR